MPFDAFHMKPGALFRASCFMVMAHASVAVAQERSDVAWGRHGAVLGAGLAFHGVAQLQARQPMPAWTAPLDPATLPGMDRSALGQWDPSAHRASKVLFGAALGASLATAWTTAEGDRPLVPVAIVLESGFLSSGITEVVKEATRRPRPYLFDPANTEAFQYDREDHRGFWSGHTAHTAAITFATANLVQRSDASPGVKTATWIGAATVPAAMGWWRVRSGRHFPTDVLTGYAFGALVGWAVPYLHRRAPGGRH